VPAAPPGTRIVLKATADAWVTVKQKAGPPLMSKLMHQGDSWPVPPDRTDLVMTTGNAGGTEVDVDGTAVASLGPSGFVRKNVPLDPEVLKSGLPAPAQKFKPKASDAG
jgi:cytoskeleton protein RodZ